MTIRDRQQRTRGLRQRRVRPALVLLGLLVCLLLLPTATANADVMAKYRSKYKNKLNSYERKIDAEYDFYSAWRTSCQSHSDMIGVAKNDPELQDQIPQLEAAAMLERSLLQDTVAETRKTIYANIAAFKATGVKWFKTRADKARFKTRLATMRGGFVQIFSADEDLMEALYLLGTNADTDGAENEMWSGDMTKVTAEDLFKRGMKQLRALQ